MNRNESQNNSELSMMQIWAQNKANQKHKYKITQLAITYVSSQSDMIDIFENQQQFNLQSWKEWQQNQNLPYQLNALGQANQLLAAYNTYDTRFGSSKVKFRKQDY